MLCGILAVAGCTDDGDGRTAGSTSTADGGSEPSTASAPELDALDAEVPFVPIGDEADHPDVDPGSPLRQLTATIERTQPTAVPGEPYQFVVALANPTDDDIALDPCPGYHIGLGDDATGIGVDHVLSCPDGAVVPAGGTLTFAMAIDVPADYASEARVPIFWRLEPYLTAARDPGPVVAS